MVSDATPSFVWRALASGRDGPGPRSRHGFVYDLGAEAIILFGGIHWAAGGALLSDTWEFRDGEWSPIKLRNHPRPRHRGAMVYDGRRGQCVLFGGQTQNGRFFSMLGDTWTFANRRWRHCEPGSGSRPSPRCGHALAFDEGTGLTVLFGGIAPYDRPLGDTWLFDGSSWHPVAGPAPAPRRYAAFAYDPGLKGCVLNGGSEDDRGAHGYGDTWLFRDRTWTRLPSCFDTAVHDDHGLAYHRAAKRLVMFGGLRGEHGIRVREADGWRAVEAGPVPPRHQCSPLTWDGPLQGLVFHGGEARHGGPQFDTTWVLQLAGATPCRPTSRRARDRDENSEEEARPAGVLSWVERLFRR